MRLCNGLRDFRLLLSFIVRVIDRLLVTETRFQLGKLAREKSSRFVLASLKTMECVLSTFDSYHSRTVECC